LPELHAQGLQRLLLALGLDALGNHPGSDMAAEGEQRDDQRPASAVGVDGGDQERSTLMNSGRSSAITRMLACPAPASSTAILNPRARNFRRDALQQGEVGNRLPLAELEDDRSRVDPRVGDGFVERGDAALVDQGADENVDEESASPTFDAVCSAARTHARSTADCMFSAAAAPKSWSGV